jgi:Flp pilus assembly protein TadD
MKYSRYSWWFAGVALILTVTALATYREISAMTFTREERVVWIEDSTMAIDSSTPPPFASLYIADEAWRLEHARQYSLAELRARGDGRRTARQQMQDRVYAHSRAGNRGSAIRELERWVRSNPRDTDALLWLARLLNDAGRSAESVRRYRQALSVEARR